MAKPKDGSNGAPKVHSKDMTYRLGILVSHPIQYYAPWFRYLAGRMDIEVFYAHRQDAKAQSDAGFGVKFEWDIPLLEGYPYRWLKNVAANPSIGTFRGLDTPELFNIIQPGSFDAFLLFGWNRKCSWQAIRACRRSKVPVLMRGDSHLETKRSDAVSLVKYLPYRAFLPCIDAHLYVGQRNKAYLKHYGVSDERLFFSPHFVDAEFFSRVAREAKVSGSAAALRCEFGIPADAFVILFVGKLILVKRPFDFIAAALKILSEPEVRNVHAIVVGDGPLRSSLEASVAEHRGRVHFAGFQNQSAMPLFYQIADVLVVPSAAETWGLVVNEALACGIPVIASNTVGCAPDLIDEGRIGFTFPMGNVDALQTCILALAELAGRDGQSMSKAIEEKSKSYSMRVATDGLLGALNKVVASTGRCGKAKALNS